MKTIKDTGPLFYACRTDRMSDVPKGKVRIFIVRYQTYEYEEEEFKKLEGSFHVHDANSWEAREIAKLVALPPSS